LIEVTVVRIKGSQVRVATDTAKHLPASGEELLYKLSDDAPWESWRREDFAGR
jgi:sRNA-binding carbon storage regulator CsrA